MSDSKTWYTSAKPHRGYKVLEKSTGKPVEVVLPKTPKQVFIDFIGPSLEGTIEEKLQSLLAWKDTHPQADFHESEDGYFKFGEYLETPNPAYEAEKNAYEAFHQNYLVEYDGPAIEL